VWLLFCVFRLSNKVKQRSKNAAVKLNCDKIKLVNYAVPLRCLLRTRIALHLASPSKKPEELSLFPPEEIPEVSSPHCLRLLA
jgi:hypothetical protein